MRLAVLTTGRQDWGILRSTYLALRDSPEHTPILIAGGMHASTRFGHTVDDLIADGCPPDHLVPWIDDTIDETPAWQQAGLPLVAGQEQLLSPRIDRYRRPYEGTDNASEAMQAYLDWEFGLVEQLGRDGTHGFFVM